MMQRILILITIIFIFRGCASITTPSGGPKDLKAPKLIASTPSVNQTNFKGKTVELTFNELVKLNNPREEIIISPSAGKNVEIKVRGAKVTLTPELPWQDSTTYSIQFREGIQDITESNIPINLKLAFSTGPEIDTLHITGRVKDLLKGTIAEKITVGLYAQDTFDIFTDTARYFTKTDKKGKFKLENIKAGRYKIYAFDDKNKNLRAESQSERFGFQSQWLTLDKDLDSLSLGLIMLDSRKLKISTIRNAGTITRLRFNKAIADYSVQSDSNITNAFGDTRTEVVLWNPTGTDSVKMHFTATDSLSNKVDSTFYVKTTKAKSPKEVFKWSLGSPIVDSETGSFKTIISFNKPITDIDLDSLYIKVDTASAPPPPTKKPELKGSKIPTDTLETPKDSLQTDSVHLKRVKPWIIPITKQEITLDMRVKEITIAKQLDLKIFKLKKDPVLQLNANKGFVYSIDKDTSKVLSATIPILWPEDTGIVLIEVNSKEKNYIIQLLEKSGKIVASARNVPKQSFKNLPPMDYQIRIILDANNNGKWDPGNFYDGLEPEKVVYYLTPKRQQSFAMRANWENGPLILKF